MKSLIAIVILLICKIMFIIKKIMKNRIKLIFILIASVIILSACSESEASLVFPEFQKYNVAESYEEQIYDVLELDLSYGQIKYTDIGDVKNGEYILDGSRKHLMEYNFYEHTRYTDGIIIYNEIAYAFYRDSNGNAFIRCVDEKFKPEYGVDKPYIEFIDWAKYYTRRVDDEDLTSR